MVYVHALHHLAPFARQVAGAQAVPSGLIEPRRWLRLRGRERRFGPFGGNGPTQAE
jgi:hypothetical protein